MTFAGSAGRAGAVSVGLPWVSADQQRIGEP